MTEPLELHNLKSGVIANVKQKLFRQDFHTNVYPENIVNNYIITGMPPRTIFVPNRKILRTMILAVA